MHLLEFYSGIILYMFRIRKLFIFRGQFTVHECMIRTINCIYRVILSVLDSRKCEYLKDYSLDFEHAYMTTCLAS